MSKKKQQKIQRPQSKNKRFIFYFKEHDRRRVEFAETLEGSLVRFEDLTLEKHFETDSNVPLKNYKLTWVEEINDYEIISAFSKEEAVYLSGRQDPESIVECDMTKREVDTCFKCERRLHVDHVPYDCVVMTGGDNYGSQTYDACVDGIMIELLICDRCLDKNRKLYKEYQNDRKKFENWGNVKKKIKTK